MEMNTRDILLNNEDSMTFLEQLHHPDRVNIEERDAIFSCIDKKIFTKIENGIISAEIVDMDTTFLEEIFGNSIFNKCQSSIVCEVSDIISVKMVANSFGKCA